MHRPAGDAVPPPTGCSPPLSWRFVGPVGDRAGRVPEREVGVVTGRDMALGGEPVEGRAGAVAVSCTNFSRPRRPRLTIASNISGRRTSSPGMPLAMEGERRVGSGRKLARFVEAVGRVIGGDELQVSAGEPCPERFLVRESFAGAVSTSISRPRHRGGRGRPLSERGNAGQVSAQTGAPRGAGGGDLGHGFGGRDVEDHDRGAGCFGEGGTCGRRPRSRRRGGGRRRGRSAAFGLRPEVSCAPLR